MPFVRRLVAIGMTVALVLVASGCSGDAAVSSEAKRVCGRVPSPGAVALTFEPVAEPSQRAEVCRIADTYSDIVGDHSWTDLPMRLASLEPRMRTWQRRMLLHACGDCSDGGLDLAEVRRSHPEWVLRDGSGQEVHSPGRPGEVLLDFGDPDYQAAWAQTVEDDLEAHSWTGVEITDVGNDQRWSSDPIDPRTNRPMTSADRARYIAEALALVRGALKTDGHSVVAVNGPPGIVDAPQIASTDAVTVGEGFAGRRSGSWDELFRYFDTAVDREVGSWVQDAAPVDERERVFAFASYLLVSGPLSSYGPPGQPDDPLYRISLGPATDDPARDGAAWTRRFEKGVVAVAPGPAPADVRLPDGTSTLLDPGQGLIVTADGRRID